MAASNKKLLQHFLLPHSTSIFPWVFQYLSTKVLVIIEAKKRLVLMKAVELYVHGFKDWCQNEAKPCKRWKNSGVISWSVSQASDVLISHVSGKFWLV